MASAPTITDVYEGAVAPRTGLRTRFLEPDGHPRIHVLETPDGSHAGGDVPTILLHGGGASALSYLPLLEQLDGHHLVAVDRPGFGRSGPVRYDPETFRSTAVRFVGAVLDALGTDRANLVGNSMGGLWAIWFALDHPERVRRLALVGAPPLTPGTSIPAPLRILAAPGLGELMGRLMTPSPKTVRQMMGAFGEADTIGHHPEVVDSLVATGADERIGAANLAETRAVLTTLRGFRPDLELTETDLSRLEPPTLLVWGADDPVGGEEVGRRLAGSIPQARLELLEAGHMPWLGHPSRTAELLAGFLES